MSSRCLLRAHIQLHESGFAHQLYATPVLFSGLALLVLSNSELIIDAHYKSNLKNLQRLYPNTHRGIIYFLAKSHPGEASLDKNSTKGGSQECAVPNMHYARP